jgi:cytochrome c biogenesis protein
LFVRRRRLWVRALPADGPHTVVEVGGLARTDAEAFAAEFDELVARLRNDIPQPTAQRE